MDNQARAQLLRSKVGEPSGLNASLRFDCGAEGAIGRMWHVGEDKGLLTPRRVNGARICSRRDRARLALILRSLAIGAPLSAIKQSLDMYGTHGEGRVPQLRFVLERTVRASAELETKRAHIDASLAELRVINATVRNELNHQ